MTNKAVQKWGFVHFGLADYLKIQQIQLELVHQKYHKQLNQNLILWGEHYPVFTLGRRGEKQHVLVSSQFLKARNISIVQSERGGDVTYHGPGQLIGYLILCLEDLKIGIAQLVTLIEELIIQTLRNYHVKAVRSPLGRGVWVNNKKIASIGLAIRRGITFHGFALNVSPDLAPFQWINPCGFKNMEMTSLSIESNLAFTWKNVLTIIQNKCADIFGIQWAKTTLNSFLAYELNR